MAGLLHLKDRVRHIRGNISPSEFARRLGVDRRTVNRWETGTLAPGTEAIINLVYAYGVDANWLLTGHSLPLHENVSQAERTIIQKLRCADERLFGEVFSLLGIKRYRIERHQEDGSWHNLAESDDLESALAMAGVGVRRIVDLYTGLVVRRDGPV